MMKRKTIALLFLMITLLCGMTGCADFAFNPIGRWDFIEQRMYIDDVLQEDDADNPVIHTSLVFQKSGTGYIDAYTGPYFHMSTAIQTSPSPLTTAVILFCIIFPKKTKN